MRSDASAMATAATANAIAALASEWLPSWMRAVQEANCATAASAADAPLATVRALAALLAPTDDLPPCAEERMEHVQVAAATALDRALQACRRPALLPAALEAISPCIVGARQLRVEAHTLLFMAVASSLMAGGNNAGLASGSNAADADAWCEGQFSALMGTVLNPVQGLLDSGVDPSAFYAQGAPEALGRAVSVMHAVVLCASTAPKAKAARAMVWRHGCATLLSAALRGRAAFAAAVASSATLPDSAVAAEEGVLRLAGACIDTMRGEAGSQYLRQELGALLEQLRAVPPTFGGIGGGAGAGGALSLLARAVRSPERSLDELVPPLLDACLSTARAALSVAMSSSGNLSAAAGAQLHLYRLPLDVLRYRWRYFAGSSSAAMAAALAARQTGAVVSQTAGGGGAPRGELAAQILSHALSAFAPASAQGNARPPPDVLRAVLDAARMLNKQRRLYSSAIFSPTREAFVTTLMDIQLDDTHRPLHDAARAELYAMAAVDMRGFLGAFLPQYLGKLSAASGVDTASFATSFASVGESCGAPAFGMASEALATDARLHGRRAEATKAPALWAQAIAAL